MAVNTSSREVGFAQTRRAPYSLEEESGSGCVLSLTLQLVQINEGWERFAFLNGGATRLRRWPVGANVLDAISPALPERYRRFRMVVWPIGREVYAVDGVVSMCSHCRRVRNPVEPGRWDWIPQWLGIPPAVVSHGLCPGCATYYYE